ncbi:MAG: cytochrome d ubiquinol oxidase subunit II [Gammaproteobacteria bacterium]
MVVDMDAEAVLRIFWWLALGALVAGMGIWLVGDLGLALLLRALGRNESERREIVSRVGRVTDGHQVWLILAGGAVVGAWWPLFQTSLFSGLWLVLLFIAIAVAVGPVGRGYRHLVGEQRRGAWDALWAMLSLAALLVMGIGVGAVVSGAPFRFDAHMDASWGGFFGRFTPYEVLVPGLLAIAFGVLLAASRVAVRCDGAVAERARKLMLPAAGLALLIFIGGAIWATQLPGYAVAGITPLGATTTPLQGTTFVVNGAYIERFLGQLPLLVIPILAGLALLGAIFYAWRGPASRVWTFAALAVVGVVATAGAMTFPVLLPSWSAPAQSLTIANAAENNAALISLLVWLGVLIPVAIAYEIWLHRRSGNEAVAQS